MPANNEYVIRITQDGNVSGTKGPVTNASATSSPDSSEKSYWAKSADSALNAAQKIVSTGTVISVADNLISYDVGTISLRTGATEYEQKIQFAYSKVKEFALPIALGVSTAGVPGAIVGGIFSLAMQGISWAQNTQTIAYKRQLENVSIGMASVRAGVTGSRSDRQ